MEVDGVPCAINRPVQIRPFATDLHVGFVHTPRCSGRPREAVPAALELRRIMMYPAHDSRVGHRQATLSHHLHQISEAELVAQIPPHAQHDDLAIEVAAFEQLLQTQKPGHRAALNPTRRPEDRRAGKLHQSRRDYLGGCGSLVDTCWHCSSLYAAEKTPRRSGWATGRGRRAVLVA